MGKKSIDNKWRIAYNSVQMSMSLEAVNFRVEPVVTQPAPPQIRTWTIRSYGSSVTRVSAHL